MGAAIDPKQMSLLEKLRLMEALWGELCVREKDVPMEDWHKQVLDEREREIAEGKATFIDCESAKQNIARRTS